MRTEKGLTLIEVMIVTLIMGFIMTSIMMALGQGTSQVASELARDELNGTMQAVFEKIEEILRDAKVLDPGNPAWDGSWIDFQVPVDDDNDGDALDNSYDIVWGVAKGLGPGSLQERAARGTISFVRRRDWAVLSEPALERNINFNTEAPRDETDVFELGGMVFTSDDDGDGAADWRRMLGGDFILQPSGNWGGDIDGEGSPDRIFWQDADGDGAPDPVFDPDCPHLMVTLWMGRAPMGVAPILVGRTVRIFLRNQSL